MIGKPRWHADLRAGLGAIAAALLLLAISYRSVWPLAIDIGAHDQRFALNFNAPEQIDGGSIRWTNGASRVLVPRPPDGARAILTLRAVNARPEDQPVPRVTLRADSRAVASFDVTRSVAGMREYRVLVETGTALRWTIPLDLDSDAMLLPQDPRPLGFMLDRVTLAPLGGTLLPPLWLIIWSMLLGLFGYGFPRSFGLSRRAALAAALLVATLVAAGVVVRPLEVLPFVQRIAALLGLCTAGVLLAQFLAPPLGTTDDEGATPASTVVHRPSSIVVKGAHLPIYLAVAWWLGPLFELIMTADGAKNVTPPPLTMWVGGALLIALAALIGVALLRRDQALLTRGAMVLLAGAAAAHLATMIWFAYTRSGPDFWILFKGAREWARGNSLYDMQAITENHFGHVFKVPPFYGMLFVPFVFDDGLRILLFHRIINTVLLAVMALVWFRMWRIPLVSMLGAGVLILLNIRPFADTIAYGQIDLALLLLLTLALWALRTGRGGAAGALVALGTLFKVYPVLLLGFFIAKRQWRALAGFVVAMLVLNGVAIAVMGWEMHRAYLFDVLPRIGGTTAWVENQTVSGFIARLVDTPREADIFTNRALALLGTALSAALILAAGLLALRPARPATTTYALHYSLLPLVMVLAVPAAWMHYETLLFIPFGVLLLHWRDGEVSLPRAVAFAASFALIGYGNQWSFYDGTVLGVLTLLGISSKFYGMLLLGGLLARVLVGVQHGEPLRAPSHEHGTYVLYSQNMYLFTHFDSISSSYRNIL